MRQLIIFSFFVLTCSCSNHPKTTDSRGKTTNDTFDQEKVTAAVDTIHSFDTATIQGKARQLILQLRDSDYAVYSGTDTLIDMNGDHQLDLLIEFYSANGTGLKNGAEIFLFDKSRNQFVKTDPIDLPNPTFDFKNNTVVSYYVGQGGGYARKLKWNGLRLDTLEYIDIDITSEGKDHIKVKSTIHNCKTGKTTQTLSDMVSLPSEYKYFDYKPIVRKE